MLSASETTVVQSGSPTKVQEFLTQLQQQLPTYYIECIQLTNLLNGNIIASTCGDKAIAELKLPFPNDGIDVKTIPPPKSGITGKRIHENQLQVVLSAPVSNRWRNLVYALSLKSSLYKKPKISRDRLQALW